MIVEQALNNHKLIEIEDDEHEHQQSSPRGVLEIPVSGSDSDNHSSVSRSLSSRGSSFNEKSPEMGGDDEEGRRPEAGLISTSSVAQDSRWRNLVCNLKWKSFKRFSTMPLVAGYEMSRKSLMRRLGRHPIINEEIIDGVRWTIPKPSWRNFTFEELTAATGGFSLGKLFCCLMYRCKH